MGCVAVEKDKIEIKITIVSAFWKHKLCKPVDLVSRYVCWILVSDSAACVYVEFCKDNIINQLILLVASQQFGLPANIVTFRHPV